MVNGDKPIISVIVPVYNVEKWLPRCLDSILNQTFIDFEVVLVNDGSLDNSLQICKEYEKKDNRIKVFTKENGGLSDARNYGIRHSQGKYLIFIDSDDFIDKEYVEKLYNAILKNNAQIAMCGYYMTDEAGNKLNVTLSSRELNIPNNKKVISGRELLKYSYKKNGFANEGVWTKIYFAELFDPLFFKKDRLFEDAWIAPYIFYDIKKVALVNIPLYNYVQRNGSIANSGWNSKKFKDKNDYHIDRLKFYKNKDDKKLYKLAVGDYIDWIWFTVRSYNLSSQEIKYLQKQIRKISRLPHYFKFKRSIQEIICNINIYLIARK